jgi:hypothetical protein
MFLENYTLSQSYTCDNLTIFLVIGADSLPEARFLTLQEALEQEQLIVHETRDVNELAIENLSAEEVYLQAGDIVKGGWQDRVLAYDVIAPAQSGRIPVGAFCVEQGRWRQRTDESGREESEFRFRSSDHRVHSKALKVAAFVNTSQSEVWDKVSEAQDRLSAKLGVPVRESLSATSLQLTLEHERINEEVDRYVRELASIVDRAEGNVIGYAFAINGQVNSAEVYASGALFRKLWLKLLKANAVEAVAEFEEGKNLDAVSVEQVKAYLDDNARGKAVEQQVTPRIRVVKYETDKTILQATCDQARNGAWIHSSCLVK